MKTGNLSQKYLTTKGLDVCKSPGYVSAYMINEHYDVCGHVNGNHNASFKGFY